MQGDETFEDRLKSWVAQYGELPALALDYQVRRIHALQDVSAYENSIQMLLDREQKRRRK